MNSRNTFFEFARDNNNEFSSLRRAQFSTMCILYELHNQDNKIDYVCNICKLELETWYHCRVCEDYDLCADCNKNMGHDHEMNRMGPRIVNAVASDKQTSPSDIIEVDSDTSVDEAPPSDLPPNLDPSKQTHPLIFESLKHACKGSGFNCGLPLCPMRAFFTRHLKFCPKNTGACDICKMLNKVISTHLEDCQNANCSYSFCRKSKAHIDQQQQQQKERQHIDFMLTIASSLQKQSTSILNNLKSTDPQEILNVAYEITRIQIQLQECISAQIRTVGATDSAGEDQGASAPAQN